MSWREQRWTPCLGTFVVACVAAVVLAVVAYPASTQAAGGVQVETTSTDCQPKPDPETLCGKVTIEGGGSGRYFFEFAQTWNNYEFSLPAEPGDPIYTTAEEPGKLVFMDTRHLPPGTSYFIRLVAVVGGERVVGEVIAFTVAPDLPEEPITEACPASGEGKWMACGTVNPHQDSSVGFYFLFNQGAHCEGGWETPVEQIQGEGVPVSAELPGLLPDTEYTYCLAVVSPENYTAVGDGLSFVTATEPVAVPPGGGSSSADTTPPSGGGGTDVAPSPPVPPDEKAQASTIRLKLMHALQRCAKRSGPSRTHCARKARHRFRSQLRAVL